MFIKMIMVYTGGRTKPYDRKNELLDKPWEVLSQYFDKLGFCRKSQESSIIRHNYIPIKLSPNSIKLKCKHCGHELVNGDISGLSKVKKAKLWEEDQNKNPGDITIYLNYWRKNQDDEWLPFPGLFYSGQT